MLIPFRETQGRGGTAPKAFRWSFQIGKYFIGFIYQYNIDDKWCDAHSLTYGFWYHGKWCWGFSHLYYDGPHCTLSIGPFRIQWYNENCKKCYDED
jgi:hypothetical protein